jgi:hypothetical protein
MHKARSRIWSLSNLTIQLDSTAHTICQSFECRPTDRTHNHVTNSLKLTDIIRLLQSIDVEINTNYAQNIWPKIWAHWKFSSFRTQYNRRKSARNIPGCLEVDWFGKPLRNPSCSNRSMEMQMNNHEY